MSDQMSNIVMWSAFVTFVVIMGGAAVVALKEWVERVIDSGWLAEVIWPGICCLSICALILFLLLF